MQTVSQIERQSVPETSADTLDWQGLTLSSDTVTQRIVFVLMTEAQQAAEDVKPLLN